VYPVLTHTNYEEWSLVMHVNLQAAGLWDAINKVTDNYRDDQNALAALLRAVPTEMQAGLAVKEIMKEAWEAILSMQVIADKLCQEFDNISFKSTECVEEFAMHISSLANQLRSLGDEITDKKVVKQMLQSVPDHLEQVAISVETLLDPWRRWDTCRRLKITRRRSRPWRERKLAVSYCSQGSSGRLDQRLPLVRSLVAAMVEEVVAAGSEEVTVTHDLNRIKGGKMVMVLMGRLKNVAIVTANRAILLGNVDLRRRRDRPTGPKRKNPHSCNLSAGRLVLTQLHKRVKLFQISLPYLSLRLQRQQWRLGLGSLQQPWAKCTW
jgi:hypothetical protein